MCRRPATGKIGCAVRPTSLFLGAFGPIHSVTRGLQGPVTAAVSAFPRLLISRSLRTARFVGDGLGRRPVMDEANEFFAERCAGLDVHQKTVVATVRVPGVMVDAAPRRPRSGPR